MHYHGKLKRTKKSLKISFKAFIIEKDYKLVSIFSKS